MPESKFGFADSVAVLQIRDFRFFLLSRFFATLASQMQVLVVSWQIYKMTKDPLALGLVGLIEASVFILFSFRAGHFSDQREKKIIILVAQAVLAVCGLALMALTSWGARVWAIYSIVAVTGFARSYLWPASFSYSELTVPRAIYSRAAAWNATGWEIGSILGPALGGILYAWKGPMVAYSAVACLAVLGIFFAFLMGKRPPVIATPEEPHEVLSGVRFVIGHPILLGAMSLDMFAVLFGGVYAILPIFADLYGVGPRGLGWLRAAPSMGAILMAIYQQYRPPLQRAGRTILTVVVLYGLSMIAFALSKSYRLSLLILAFSGVADNVSVVIRASIMQAFTPDSMRGRVSSVNGVFIGSSNEIGAFESGLAAKLMGTIPSVLFGGAMTLLTVVLIAWKTPQLRGLKSLHKPS